ncbi:Protein NRT1/ PTR family 2.11 [Vitis vinifera]|uniref:Protein NRT1/ PTR family 2.11 n=1 Tax=Vitis vinifera TaxID=29760 RepID=A0A438I3A9_VITVI|nr:Protein NRT1/ PTR family 2.11 [Vitis vinifera]
MEKNEKAGTADEPNFEYRGLKAMPFIIGNETFENLGTVGTSSNLLVYLTAVFNMKSITAVTLINIFYGTTNLGTLVGAFLCDTYFGRYKTLGFATVASFMGMLVITLTALISKLHPPHCEIEQTGTCIGPTSWQIAFLLLGFGLLVIEPVASDHSDVSWALGLAIPTFLMLLACVLFFMGTRIYVKLEPKGSPLKSVVQVIVAAARKRQLKLPEQPWLTLFSHVPSNSINSKLPYTDQFRFLDKGAIITPEDQINSEGLAADPWRLSSIQQVEEVKCLMRVIPIWASAIIYYVALAQQQTYTVFQSFNLTGILVTAISRSRLHLTVHRKRRRHHSPPKDGCWHVSLYSNMLVSAFVEHQRRTLALCEPTLRIDPRRGAISSMSGLWFIPQLTLVGVSEAFTVIAQVEFFYKQFPESMRSVGGSFSFLGVAVSSYLSSFLVSTVHRMTAGAASGNWLPEDLNKGRLDYFYYLVAALGVINLGYFLLCAKWYKYKGSACSTQEVPMERVESEKPLV